MKKMCFIIWSLLNFLTACVPLQQVENTQVRTQGSDSMVFIPAGSFMMGSEIGYSKESPVHEVSLEAFWIDQTEVTNAMYAHCVAAGGCNQPPHVDNVDYRYTDPAYADYPIVFVSWQDARDYCEWFGARLPSEAEWEYAARGGLEGAIYPWGDETPICEDGAINGASFSGCDERDTHPIGSYSPNGYGLYDMAGNVWEWTSSLLKPYPYNANDGREDLSAQGYRIFRGGGYWQDENGLRVSARGYLSTEFPAYGYLGFRCAKSP